MPQAPDGQLQKTALDEWIRDAGGLVADLDSGCAIARSLLDGSPEANLVALDALSVLTLHADLWLLVHPCGDETLGQICSEIVEVLTDIGRLAELSAGDVTEAGADSLAFMVEGAGELLGQFKALTSVLTR